MVLVTSTRMTGILGAFSPCGTFSSLCHFILQKLFPLKTFQLYILFFHVISSVVAQLLHRMVQRPNRSQMQAARSLKP